MSTKQNDVFADSLQEAIDKKKDEILTAFYRNYKNDYEVANSRDRYEQGYNDGLTKAELIINELL